ncbi:MAG: aldo/keto reductase [Ignavibacteria bacterium GWA2_55_11]|nr:MAG: aldo/keto reductase [Ignavibacteria bacterium GWA2_55_11]
MKYRTLGRTGFKVSEVGFGAWGIGGGLWHGSEDAASMRALEKAIDLGLTFIDTALAYNSGHSEQLISRALHGRKERVVVATKIPPKNGVWPAQPGTPIVEAFPAHYIRECTEKSLRNLDVDAIDLLQFHVWNDAWAHETEWQETVRTLKKEGYVCSWGISINDHQPRNVLKTLDTGLIDTVQVIYNVFDQSPEEELFPICQEKRIGVIVRVPLDEGGLTGAITEGTVFSASDFRARYFRGDRKQQVRERTERLKKLLGLEAATLAELALRFCLSHPAVSTVIPGMRTIVNVERNCAVSDGRALTPLMLSELKKHRWERNFYGA